MFRHVDNETAVFQTGGFEILCHDVALSGCAFEVESRHGVFELGNVYASAVDGLC